jgi:hypothetical protein
MITRTGKEQLRRIRSRLLISVAALAAALGALAPAASGYGFQPETAFINGTAPVQQPFEPLLPDFSNFETFTGTLVEGINQGVFWAGKDLEWIDNYRKAEELKQAGAHPDFTTSFYIDPTGPGGDKYTKDIFTDLPAGSVGAPLSVPRCDAAELHLSVAGKCPTESQVGEALTTPSGLTFYSPVYSLVPPEGESAAFAYKAFFFTATLFPRVRSESDYGLTVEVRNVPTVLPLEAATLNFWGVAYDGLHDEHRFETNTGTIGASVEGSAIRPFTTAPTNCVTGPLDTKVKIRSWGKLETWHEEDFQLSEQEGCGEVEYDPEVHATPSTNVADSPSGLNINVQVPQNTECQEIEYAAPAEREEAIENGESTVDCPLSTSPTKKLKIALPEGMTLNPSAANGLGGCSPAGIGLTTPVGSQPVRFTADPANCPDVSKIGTVEVDTPLLEAPMPGQVFLAEPDNNPFNSLLAIYIGVDDRKRGIVAKFAGQIEADPVTGRLVTVVDEQPQLPLEEIRIQLKQGPHAALRTPPTCGTYTTESELTPYSAPETPVDFEDSFSIVSSPAGCGSSPHAPVLDAGTVAPIAGQYSPFVVNLSRGDGTQEFQSVTLSLPKGISAKLAGIPYCPDTAIAAAAAKSGQEEQGARSCPAASDVGSVVTGAGAGPSPYYTQGRVYLAGPYKGAPLSMAVIVPAKAGPFDLGTVVVRVALQVDPVTAKITALSDQIPRILQGIPLDIRSVAIQLNRSQFTRNATSCDPTSVGASLISTLGAVAPLSQRFQLGECRRLGFKPKLFLRLDGKRFTRTANPRLTAVVMPREGDANISSAQVLMPPSLLLDQSHIRTVCTRAQFAADACPEGSIYGRASAETPLFDQPLSGNVYLRSSQNKLPDLVADLNGQVSVELSGRTDSVKGALRNTFDVVPDAPVSKFVLQLQGGQKSLLQARRNLCRGKQKATVTMRGHNGRASVFKQRINIPRCGKKPRRKHARHLRAAARHGG